MRRGSRALSSFFPVGFKFQKNARACQRDNAGTVLSNSKSTKTIENLPLPRSKFDRRFDDFDVRSVSQSIPDTDNGQDAVSHHVCIRQGRGTLFGSVPLLRLWRSGGDDGYEPAGETRQNRRLRDGANEGLFSRAAAGRERGRPNQQRRRGEREGGCER